MTLNDIVQDIITLRFKAGEASMIKSWVNQRYAMVWAAVNWPFKFAGPINFTLTAGDSTPTSPSGVHRVMPNGLRDDQGNPLTYREPQDFFDAYVAQTGTGRPNEFTVLNGQVTVAPIPNVNYTYTIVYERQLSHLEADGSTVTVGPMDEDDDRPLWDAAFHYILVPAAMSTGLKLQNDPTWQALEDEFERQLTAMANHYLPPDRPGTTQYGADNLGYEVVW